MNRLTLLLCYIFALLVALLLYGCGSGADSSNSLLPTTFTVTPSQGDGGVISLATPQTVESGESITFTATPDSGRLVKEWIVDGTVVQTGGLTYTLSNIIADHTVAVSFELPLIVLPPTITPSAAAGGGISPNTPQSVTTGGSITFSAVPNPGYLVQQWTVDGTVVQMGGPTYTLSNITADHTVAVSFELPLALLYSITPSASTGGGISPSASQYVAGGSINFTATPSDGYIIDVWKVDGATVQTGGATYTLSNIANDHTVAVSFKRVYTITTNYPPTYDGNVTPLLPQSVPAGGSITYTAHPTNGYRVTNWTVDGTVVQRGGLTYTLSNINANHTVLVDFAKL